MTLYLIIVLLLIICMLLLQDNIELFTNEKDPFIELLKEQLSIIDPRIKHVEIYKDGRSYTINKKKTYICLKDSMGRYYNRNMLCYVILHEYAHILCDQIGHTQKFAMIFKDLLKRAELKGVYDSKVPIIDNYCGMS